MQVDYPIDQTCCGQPMANSGAHAEAKATEELFVRNFADFDYVVAPSGSCVHHIRNKFTAADDTAERDMSAPTCGTCLNSCAMSLTWRSFRGPGSTTRLHSMSVARRSAGWGSSQ